MRIFSVIFNVIIRIGRSTITTVNFYFLFLQDHLFQGVISPFM